MLFVMRIVLVFTHRHWLSQEGASSTFRPRPPAGFQFFMEFQSHEAEFDYLKSMEIEEKINEIAWCPSSGGSLFMLTTNGEDRPTGNFGCPQ